MPVTTLPFEQLRFFTGSPPEFWRVYLSSLASYSGASAACIYLEDGEKPRRIAGALAGATEEQFQTAAELALRDGEGFVRLNDGGLLSLRLDTGETARCAAVLALRTKPGGFGAIATQLKLVTDTPRLYNDQRRLREADAELGRFAGALDLLLVLANHERFAAAALALCDELATRFCSRRVSLGWLEARTVHARAISRMEKFERRMEVVQRLEAAMEEALDQDEEILWPAAEESGAITRDHATFSREQGGASLLSLPIRIEHAPAGVLLLERDDRPYSEDEVRTLRLICDQAARRLHDLHERDGWFGRRLARRCRKNLSVLFGPQHTWAKLGAVVGTLTLAGLILIPVPYRVEAPFILRSDAKAVVPAPFDGYLQEVMARPGDLVAEGQTLLRLDDRDLKAQVSGSEAEFLRYRAEADAAQGEQQPAEMRVALERLGRAQAELEVARYRLARIELKSPFAGVVVTGDLRERIGAPVKRGEPLFEVAQLKVLYAEIKVDERDVHEVHPDAAAKVAFVGRPEMDFPFHCSVLEPAAKAEPGGNFFIVRANAAGEPQNWWRPGMSGIAKIDAGRRSPLWILTHRAVDFLRLRLWW